MSHGDTEEHAAHPALAVRLIDPIGNDGQHGLIFHGQLCNVGFTVVTTFEFHSRSRSIDHSVIADLVCRQAAQIAVLDHFGYAYAVGYA